jgi:hypothetical protein
VDQTQPSDPLAFGRARRTAAASSSVTFIARSAVVLALLLVSALSATALARWLRGAETAEAKSAGKFPGRALRGWTKPDLTLVLTGQQHGFLKPCGCSHPQVGGMERRYNLLQMFKKNGWPYAAFDLGDLPQRTGPAGLPNQQGLLKYVYAMRGLKAMDYSAVGFGEYEVKLGLYNVLTNYCLNEAPPDTLSANLMDAEKNFPDMVRPWKAVDVKGTGLRVGVAAVTGPTLAARIKEQTRNDTTLRFAQTRATLDNVLTQFKAGKVDLPVLLYQGPLSRNMMKRPPTEAIACAEAYPQFPIVVCQSDEDEPPSRPHVVEHRDGRRTLVITLGHKGKFVGVVGVWKTGKRTDPYTFRYECVEMTEDEFETPRDRKKGHPLVALLEDYARELRDRKYLEKYGQVRHELQVMPEVKGLRNPVPVTYIGSEKCGKCHGHAYDIWKKTAHAHAYKTLVEEKFPSNRQYDPECIVCHTVGFGYQGGYENEKKTPHLKNVGCENCHGPGSAHAKNPTDPTWQMRINPWKYIKPKNKREDAMDQVCQKCHDAENDVHYTPNGFKKKWPLVEHTTPKMKDE